MRSAPFYTQSSTPAATAYWHDNEECQAAQAVRVEDRFPGVGTDTQHCAYCARLNQPLRTRCAPPSGALVVPIPSRR